MVYERNVIEEVLEKFEIGSIKGRETESVQLFRYACERHWISRSQNHPSSLGVGKPNSFKTDSITFWLNILLLSDMTLSGMGRVLVVRCLAD
jgi:hypothetical protein